MARLGRQAASLQTLSPSQLAPLQVPQEEEEEVQVLNRQRQALSSRAHRAFHLAGSSLRVVAMVVSLVVVQGLGVVQVLGAAQVLQVLLPVQVQVLMKTSIMNGELLILKVSGRNMLMILYSGHNSGKLIPRSERT